MVCSKQKVSACSTPRLILLQHEFACFDLELRARNPKRCSICAGMVGDKKGNDWWTEDGKIGVRNEVREKHLEEEDMKSKLNKKLRS